MIFLASLYATNLYGIAAIEGGCSFNNFFHAFETNAAYVQNAEQQAWAKSLSERRQ